MNELLKINVNDNQEQTISGRELHGFLDIETPYSKWFERMCEYGFEENKDFWTKMSESTGGRPSTDHIMKLDMAKEICMLARNEKGRIARKYFIEIENDWNSPEKVIARGLMFAERQLHAAHLQIAMQNQIIAEFKPIKEYVDTILSCEDAVTTTQVAADYGISATALNKILNQQGIIRKVGGQWILYNAHMGKGYTKSETINVERNDGSIKVVMHTKWTQKGRLKIHDILSCLGIKANMDRCREKEAV